MYRVCVEDDVKGNKIQKSLSLNDVEAVLARSGFRYSVHGGMTRNAWNGVADIISATRNQISFCSLDDMEGVKCISESKAGVIFCKKDIGALIVTNGARHPYQTLILLDNPRLAFMHVMNQLYQETNPEKRTEISSNAIVSENSSIGRNCRIGNFTVIEDNCTIGDNVTIHDRVSLLKNSSIGNNCIIQPGAVIGADGFAFERYEKTMKLERFPHIGGTRIGDNVEISSNCSIARGSINDTVIGHGTKLDALVHVAHNVEIGRNCILTAGAIIGGSTIVGDTTWLGLNCTLKNKIKIGNKVIVGSGANVINDIPDGDIVAGVPAKSIRNKVTCRKLFMMAGQGT